MAAQRVSDYGALVSARKQCRSCPNLTNPAACEGGRYDSDQVGPWSLWQGNHNADLMVVGQDWGDDRYFVQNAGHDERRNRTNETLRALLKSIGIAIEAPTDDDNGGGSLFFTNAVLCLKRGGMQANVDPAWFVNCSSRFLKPTIEIVNPKAVVTLGERAYRAVAFSYGIKPLPFRAAVEHEGRFE